MMDAREVVAMLVFMILLIVLGAGIIGWCIGDVFNHIVIVSVKSTFFSFPAHFKLLFNRILVSKYSTREHES